MTHFSNSFFNGVQGVQQGLMQGAFNFCNCFGCNPCLICNICCFNPCICLPQPCPPKPCSCSSCSPCGGSGCSQHHCSCGSGHSRRGCSQRHCTCGSGHSGRGCSQRHCSCGSGHRGKGCSQRHCSCRTGHRHERGLLSEFEVDELRGEEKRNTSLADDNFPPDDPRVPIPITRNEEVIAELTGNDVLQIDDRSDRVRLSFTVGWWVNVEAEGSTTARVIFRIRKDNPGGEVIFSTVDSGDLANANNRGDNFQTTSGFTVDERPISRHGQQRVRYFLTVEKLGTGPNPPFTFPSANAEVIGPITFIGEEIERNRRRER